MFSSTFLLSERPECVQYLSFCYDTCLKAVPRAGCAEREECVSGRGKEVRERRERSEEREKGPRYIFVE